MPEFARVEDAVQALAAGKVIIVVDSEERENEGDFLAAAETITPEIIHFMTTHGRGHLCMPIAAPIAHRMALNLIVPREDPSVPAFAVPVDSRQCTTGISPRDRALTIHSLLDPFASADDFLRPGHIFPLIAEDGGVLQRPGHTEASIDLTTLAGLAPAGVLCEICSRDGNDMALLPELLELADQFDLLVLTIDDLIDYRRQTFDDASNPEHLLLDLREI